MTKTTDLRVGQKVRRFKSQDFQTIAEIRSSAATLERAKIVFTDGTSAETGWAAEWNVDKDVPRCHSCGAPLDGQGSCLGVCDPADYEGEGW